LSNEDDDDYSGEDWWPLLSLSEQSALLAETDREWAAITKRGHNLNKKAYMRGRAFEERGMRYWKDRGWFAIRSFASLGPVDYLAYKSGVGYLVQAKWSGYRDTGPEHFVTEAAGLTEVAKGCGGVAMWQGVIRAERVGMMTFWYWDGGRWAVKP